MASAQAGGSLHPDIESLIDQLAAIRADADRLVDGLTNDQFNWRSAADRWSIAQCITHLNLVDGLDLKRLGSAVADARRAGMTGSGPFRYGKVSSWFIARTEPPARLRVKAPTVYVPPETQHMDVAMAEFRRVQAGLAELVAQANGLDLARVKVPTPIGSWVRFSLGQRFRLITAHDRRHLHQAWEVRRALP